VQLHPSFTLLEALITNGSVLHLILNDDPYRGRPLYVRVKDGSDEEGRIRMITCGADFYVADVKEDLSYFNGIFFIFIFIFHAAWAQTSTWRTSRRIFRTSMVFFLFFYFLCGVGADFYVADVKEDLSNFNGIYFFYFIFFYFSCGVGADFYMADVKEDLSYFNGEALQIIISYVTTNYYFLCQ
jgi:hypothetical protein